MVTQPVTFKVSGFEALERRVDAARLLIKDLSPMFEQFGVDLRIDAKRRFQLRGPGKYQDLSDKYKKRKQKIHGFTYPILFATGKLAKSLLEKNAEGSVYVVEKQSFLYGTRIPYADYHHSKEPRKKIPRRPIFEEDENSPTIKRLIRIADAYLKKAMKGAFDGESGSGNVGVRGNRIR